MNSEKARKRKERLYRWKTYGEGYLFMLPWLIGFAVFMAYPVVWSFTLSFLKVRLKGGYFDYAWNGLNNYRDALFKDNVYPIELIVYFQEVLLMIPLIVIFALMVALLLNHRFPGRMWFRAVFFLPVIFATGQVLAELFRQQTGELPFLGQYENLDEMILQAAGPQFGGALVNVIGRGVLILWYSGVQILIFIAGFQTVPKTIYEAVRIDGASPWTSFWKITLPASAPFIGLNVVYTIVDLFTFPFNPVMAAIRSTMFLPDFGYGYASAQAWIYFMLILVLIGLSLWFVGRSFRRERGMGA